MMFSGNSRSGQPLSIIVDRSPRELLSDDSSVGSSSLDDDNDGYNLDSRIACDELNMELNMDELLYSGYALSVIDPIKSQSFIFLRTSNFDSTHDIK